MILESENILLQRFAATGDAEAFLEIVQRHCEAVRLTRAGEVLTIM